MLLAMQVGLQIKRNFLWWSHGQWGVKPTLSKENFSAFHSDSHPTFHNIVSSSKVKWFLSVGSCRRGQTATADLHLCQPINKVSYTVFHFYWYVSYSIKFNLHYFLKAPFLACMAQRVYMLQQEFYKWTENDLWHILTSLLLFPWYS